MSKSLIEKHVLVVRPELATLIGLNEAIILQQFEYWIRINEEHNRNFIDGQYWTYNSVKEWHKQFPFWSLNTLKRTIASLETKGLVKSRLLHDNPMDRSKWYTIVYEKLEEIENSNTPKGGGDPGAVDDPGSTSGSMHRQMSQRPSSKWTNALAQNEPMIYTETNTTKTNYKKRDARAIEKFKDVKEAVSQDWTPGNDCCSEIMKDCNMTLDDTENAIKEFKLHHKSKGTTSCDWEAEFKLWCIRGVRMKRPTRKHESSSKKGLESPVSYRCPRLHAESYSATHRGDNKTGVFYFTAARVFAEDGYRNNLGSLKVKEVKNGTLYLVKPKGSAFNHINEKFLVENKDRVLAAAKYIANSEHINNFELLCE